jgi:hypothetical protein
MDKYSVNFQAGKNPFWGRDVPKKRFRISIKIRSYSFSVAFSKAALPSEANSQTPPSEKAFPED